MKTSDDLMKELPEVSEALLVYLSKIFEEKSPEGNETYEELMQKAGEAKVVRHLKYIHNLQFNNDPCASHHLKLPKLLSRSIKHRLLSRLLRSL